MLHYGPEPLLYAWVDGGGRAVGDLNLLDASQDGIEVWGCREGLRAE